jgi:hypothetical protein
VDLVSSTYDPFSGTHWDIAVGIATGYGLDDLGVGVQVPVEARILISPRRPDRLWGPPNLLSKGYRGSFLGGKRQKHEADHSPPATTKVKKTWVCTSTSPYALTT